MYGKFLKVLSAQVEQNVLGKEPRAKESPSRNARMSNVAIRDRRELTIILAKQLKGFGDRPRPTREERTERPQRTTRPERSAPTCFTP